MTVAIATKHLLLNSTRKLKKHVQPVTTQGFPFFAASKVPYFNLGSQSVSDVFVLCI